MASKMYPGGTLEFEIRGAQWYCWYSFPAPCKFDRILLGSILVALVDHNPDVEAERWTQEMYRLWADLMERDIGERPLYESTTGVRRIW
jgi:hypothetical protein